MKIKAVLFDLDGTLRDTREAIYASYAHAFDVLGIPQPSKEELDVHIHHHSHVHKAFASHVTMEEFFEKYLQKVHELLPNTVLYSNALEVVREFRTGGLKVAIVSSADHAEEELARKGIDGEFDLIVGGLSTKKHKPDPEPVEFALEKLAVKPQEAIMVGDMVVDVQAARAAGLPAVIGVTHGFATRQDLQAAGADYLIDSLGELPAVMEKINGEA